MAGFFPPHPFGVEDGDQMWNLHICEKFLKIIASWPAIW